MSDVWNKMIGELSNLGGTIADKGEEYIKIAMEKGTEYSQKGKIQLEIETTKRELKKEQLIFGQFIYEKFENENATDFTLNDQFQIHTDKIKNLKNVIKSLENEKQNIKYQHNEDLTSVQNKKKDQSNNISTNNHMDFKL
ncbi:MAG: hypothetical protein CMF96_06465 [Candidatus Marinimicrobia bacterium]|nr:hypothetical protein [Candidatus Neomarinimicrobiota bacterium]|tara:strand:- start:21 stop:440 length:420 start_codon:yes stop_codon:yes gene_type:complete